MSAAIVESAVLVDGQLHVLVAVGAPALAEKLPLQPLGDRILRRLKDVDIHLSQRLSLERALRVHGE